VGRAPFASRRALGIVPPARTRPLELFCGFDKPRVLIERVDALGESPEYQLLPLSVLRGFWAASLFAFNGDVTLNQIADLPSTAVLRREQMTA
jgi:hypothetical protein